MINNTDAAYIAGLFDGEGTICYKQYVERKKKHTGKGYRTTKTWRINMEIAMTDRSVLLWLYEVLQIGRVGKKPRKGKTKSGGKYKMQWRWRVTFREAYKVAVLLFPYAHTKLEGIQKIIDHYSKRNIMNGKVVDLETYKETMNLE